MNGPVIVAGTGPGLTGDVVLRVGHLPAVCANDSWRLFPTAVALYAADISWWRVNHQEVRAGFSGRRVSCHCEGRGPADVAMLESWGVEVLKLDHGQCSGFGAITTALYLGFKHLALVGFDMRHVGGRSHFFGDHIGLRNTSDYSFALPDFERLASHLPEGVTITNCTPNSRLTAFPFAELEDLDL